jgi:ubiquinone/menaquinone biosynthesis C-methylase UbiE
VGCGTGIQVRELAAQGARVTGIDIPEMVEKAMEFTPVSNEKYIAGRGENLPFETNYADIILYAASLHHIATAKISPAIQEAHRVLKPGGSIFFIEPVPRDGDYYEITRIVEDEKEVLAFAYQAIKNAQSCGLESRDERFAYFERSYDDYVALLGYYVSDKDKRNRFLAEAKEVTLRMCRNAGVDIKDYRFKSVCRINVLQKSIES